MIHEGNSLDAFPIGYRELFMSGSAHKDAAHFIPAKHSLFFFGLLSLIAFGLTGFFAAGFFAAENPVVIGIVIASTLCLALFIVGTWCLVQFIKGWQRSRYEGNRHYYGLRIDREVIAMRFHFRWKGECCVCIPLDSISSVEPSAKVIFSAGDDALKKKWIDHFIDVTIQNGETHSIPAKYFHVATELHEMCKTPIMEGNERASHTLAKLISQTLRA